MFLLATLLILMVQEGPPPGALETVVQGIVEDVRFDFWEWETEAIFSKLELWLLQPQRYMQEENRSAFYRDFMDRLAHVKDLEWQILTIYGDPEVADPDAVTVDLQAELEHMREELTVRQPIAEAIVEEQVGTILVEEGLGVLGQPFPPPSIHFTPLPYVLIVSPRERIETVEQQELEHGLELPEQIAIEREVEENLDVSSMVTSIGGLSTWPAMLLELPAPAWVPEVSAHEWAHHYLDLRPLGQEYNESQIARTINETTASIVGAEIKQRVLARYYPDLLPPPPEASPAEEEPTTPPPEPPAFDFRAEMHRTRVEVDRLLEEGRVEEAETYMEARREIFWEHGYHIRRLNQAYFAFYGSYADELGAAGEDPIGPAVRRLYQQSASLDHFLSRIATITTMEQLLAALEEGDAG
jgi:hypothetical protein